MQKFFITFLVIHNLLSVRTDTSIFTCTITRITTTCTSIFTSTSTSIFTTITAIFTRTITSITAISITSSRTTILTSHMYFFCFYEIRNTSKHNCTKNRKHSFCCVFKEISTRLKLFIFLIICHKKIDYAS